MKKIIIAFLFLFATEVQAAPAELGNTCVRGSLQHKKSWYLKLYDGKMLLLANISIISPDGTYTLQEAFLDWTGATEGVVGYEKLEDKQTYEYVVDNGEHKKRTLTMYKFTPKCQAEIKKRMKTDKQWIFGFE